MEPAVQPPAIQQDTDSAADSGPGSSARLFVVEDDDPSPSSSAWAQVADGFVAGDAQAFAHVRGAIEGHLGYCRAFSHRADWDDFVQDVMASLLVNLRGNKIQDPGALGGWVRTATRRRFIDRMRSSRREPIATEGQAEDLCEVDAAAPLDEPADLSLTLRQVLGRLPEKHRIVVLSVHAEGYTYEETAQRTGIPLGSVKRYLREALPRLRSALE